MCKSRHKCALCGSKRYIDRMKEIDGLKYCNVWYWSWYWYEYRCYLDPEVQTLSEIKKLTIKIPRLKKHLKNL